MQMSRSTHRVLGAGVALAALAGGLSACGGSSGPSSAGSPSYSPGATLSTAQIKAISQRALEATSSAHVQMSMTMPTTGSIDARGVVATKPLAEDLTMSLMGRAMEVRMIGKAMYMHMPGLPDGIVWMKLDTSVFSKLGLGGLSSGLSNPMGMLDSLTKYIASAHYVDREKLDGVEVDHYRIVVDERKAMSAIAPSAAPSATAKLPATVTEDLFLDPQGHVSEAKVDAGVEKVDVRMSDFNQKVTVPMPPASKTKDLSDMVGQMGGSLGGL